VNAREVLFLQMKHLKIAGFFSGVPICSLYLNYPPVCSTVSIIRVLKDAILFYAFFV
jgi:hypothetical protein